MTDNEDQSQIADSSTISFNTRKKSPLAASARPAPHTRNRKVSTLNREPEISGEDNLDTMALVDACYRSVKEHRAVEIAEIVGEV